MGKEKESCDPKGWYSRGYLPHFDGGDAIQFVTFRLYDSLPKEKIGEWKYDLSHSSNNENEIIRRIEKWIDKGEGNCWLKIPAIADLVQNSLLCFDGQKYSLYAWVVMPNHVHALFGQKMGFHLSKIVQSWKSYTALHSNRILNCSGTFWQVDYFDRYIRNENHFNIAKCYIEENPVKANLCSKKEEWAFSSAGYHLAK